MNTERVEQIVSQLTLEEKAALCSGKNFWETKDVERLHVKSVMVCDGPHGLRKQEGEADHLGINKSIETVCYPSASALASSFDRRVMTDLGNALGQECQAEHVAMLLGPGLNIKRSPLCGRNFEYFSEDPMLAGEMGSAYIQALQSKGIAACPKHFACNNQETMRMTGNSCMDERTLHEIYLPAFEAAVKKGQTRSIMCAYNAINGDFCAENNELLTKILRDKWGFKGFVVTDWGGVKGRPEGVAAGLDLEMPGGPNADGAEIAKAVREGTLEEALLDRAVSNVLQFAMTAAENQKDHAQIDRQACRQLARQISSECAVLLKNDNTLPLNSAQKVAIIGELAETPRYQGAGSSHINVPHAIGALEAAQGRNIVYARGYDIHSTEIDISLANEAVAAAKSADVAVVFAGLPDSFETEGADRLNMEIPQNQNALIHAIVAANPRTVVVLHGGSNMELPWLEEVPSVLLMHLGGEQVGAATLELLYGTVNPSGHLAETWPLKLEDNPSFLNFPGEEGVVAYAEGIFVGYRYYDKKRMNVTFPFGHGLSYTDFTYSNLQVDKESLTDMETLAVCVDITNTGNCFGKAVVQLYVRDVQSTVRRPIRELRAFDKISLNPGETKTVRFELDKRAFSYYEPKIHDFFVESGEFAIEIGTSSREIVLSVPVYVEGTTQIAFTVSEKTTIGQLLKHPKGASIIQKMMAGVKTTANTDSMGEGADRMVANMMFEMPLGALVSYGRMRREELADLIAIINS